MWAFERELIMMRQLEGPRVDILHAKKIIFRRKRVFYSLSATLGLKKHSLLLNLG